MDKEYLRKQIIQYYISVGEGQNILQCIKQALFLHECFNPVLLFQVISKRKQKITSQDWRRFLEEHNISFTDEQFKYFMRQNQYKSEITLNQFLQSMLPFNADVIREFKQKYLEALQIKQYNQQVQFIFAQLLDNEFKFFRNLIILRSEITKNASLKQIQSLIKNDLINQSKTRQSVKFQQAFKNKNFKLTFHELRKFLQLWLVGQKIIHEFQILNIIRHLRSDDPFINLIYKPNKNRNKPIQGSGSKRAQSAKNWKPTVNLTNQKIKQQTSKYDNKFQSSYGQNWNQSANKDKYSNFKDQIQNQFVQSIYKHQNQSPQRNLPNQKNQRQQFDASNQQRQNLNRSKENRQPQSIQGTLIVKFLQQIIIKQDKLQKIRKNLAKNNDFNLINLFKLIDNRNKGYISPKDISQYTQLNKVQFNNMINFFAKQNDRLRFYQFCLIFRPLSKQLNELIDSRPENKIPNPFKGETNKLILQIFNLTAEMHSNLSKIRVKINNQGIDPKFMFRYLDVNMKGYLDADTFDRILKANNINCDDKNMKCLMKIFRKKIDQKISLEQFRDFVSL